MRRHTWMGALVLVLVAGLAAGCGDDDGDDATPTDPVDSTQPEPEPTEPTEPTGPPADVPEERLEFLAEADALCELANSELEAETGGAPSLDDIQQTHVPRIRQLIDDIAAIEPPPGDGEELTSILDTQSQLLDDVEEDPAILVDDTWIEENSTPASEQAASFGFETCFTG